MEALQSPLMLVLLPGMDGTGDLFAPFLRSLKNVETRVIAYPTDRFLDYDQLVAYVRARLPSIGLYVVLAESFSAPIAARIAAEPAAEMRALIICAGFDRSPIQGWKRWLLLHMASPLMRLPIGPRMIGFYLTGRNSPRWLLASVQSALKRVRPAVMAARVQALLRCERDESARVTLPSLYLQPRQDRLVSKRCAELMREAQPDVEIVYMNGPHLLLQRKPEQVAAVIQAFLDRLCGATSQGQRPLTYQPKPKA